MLFSLPYKRHTSLWTSNVIGWNCLKAVVASAFEGNSSANQQGWQRSVTVSDLSKLLPTH